MEKLHVNSESLFVLWSDMEQKYAEQLSKGKSKNKDLLKSLVHERKRYKNQLNSIKQAIPQNSPTDRGKRLHPGFAMS